MLASGGAIELVGVTVEDDHHGDAVIRQVAGTGQPTTTVSAASRDHGHRAGIERACSHRQVPPGGLHHRQEREAELVDCDAVDVAHLGGRDRAHRHAVRRLERRALHGRHSGPRVDNDVRTPLGPALTKLRVGI